MHLPFIHPTASHILGMAASVTAGERYQSPVYDVIAMDVAAKDRDGKPTDKHLRMLCDLHIKAGSFEGMLERGFQWNGADISRFWEWMIGIDRYDPRVAIASGVHDKFCNLANEGNTSITRVMGDALFVTLLMPIEFNGEQLDGVGIWNAVRLYVGVRIYSVWRFVRQVVGAWRAC